MSLSKNEQITGLYVLKDKLICSIATNDSIVGRRARADSDYQVLFIYVYGPKDARKIFYILKQIFCT